MQTIEFESRAEASGPILCQLYGGILDYLPRQVCAVSPSVLQGGFDWLAAHDEFVVVPIDIVFVGSRRKGPGQYGAGFVIERDSEEGILP